MNVLSLFDGISCGQIALERAGIKVDNYYASEIDKYAIQVTMQHYPNTVQLGDICKIQGEDLPRIDLLIGGSPCQGFSFAGKQLNFDDPRSKLFFEYVRLLKECKPKWFLLENVKMKKDYQDVISKELGVEPIEINSALVSAQNRKRLYWTNISSIEQPVDKELILKDILEISPSAIYNISKKHIDAMIHCRKSKKLNLPTGDAKCGTIIASYYKIGQDFPYIRNNDTSIRKLTPIECERLQTLPDDYTSILSNTQRYKCIGNGWTVDIIAHILKGITK